MVPPGVALAVLVGLVVLSPWPFGSAHPRTTQAIAILTLVASLVLLIASGDRGDLRVPHLILWPLVGFWLLVGLQLVPLPQPLVEVLAPGPSAVWYPDDAVAAAVLGSGPHPVSVHPEATALFNVACLLSMKNETQQAASLLEQSLRIDPSLVAASQMLQGIRNRDTMLAQPAMPSSGDEAATLNAPLQSRLETAYRSRPQVWDSTPAHDRSAGTLEPDDLPRKLPKPE